MRLEASYGIYAELRRRSAILGSAAFFLAAPCVVAGFVPWLVVGGYETARASNSVGTIAGSILVVVPVVALITAFASFALDGGGTPAPVAPTERLVINGLYRHVRNPMYVAVVTIILGQALIFQSMPLAVYAVVVGVSMALFVKLYEEPTLAGRYGPEYERYRKAVPGWVPRLKPWAGA